MFVNGRIGVAGTQDLDFYVEQNEFDNLTLLGGQ